MSKQYDLLLRLLIIGDSGVGKTCLLCRYVDDQFYPSYAATIGIDFKVKNIVVDGRRIRIQIWDTAGQERFETITKQYYRRAQGVLLVYDISNAASFKHINKWMAFVKQHGKSNVEMTAVGNKTDLDDWRQVPWQDGWKFSQKNNFGFFETSAYMDSGHLEEVFRDLVGRILVNQGDELSRQHLDSYPSSDSEDEIELRRRRAANNSKCCCIL